MKIIRTRFTRFSQVWENVVNSTSWSCEILLYHRNACSTNSHDVVKCYILITISNIHEMPNYKFFDSCMNHCLWIINELSMIHEISISMIDIFDRYIKALPWVCMKNAALGECRVVNTTWGKAKCCINHKTPPSALFSYTEA